MAEYPEEAIPALLASGVIQPTDGYWHEGMQNWSTVEARWPSEMSSTRHSVPPPVPTSDPQYKEILQGLTSTGWVVVSEGPSGVQVRRPRVMRASTKFFFVIGIVGLLAYGLGIIMIILALMDYYVLTKEETYFLNRESPTPPVVKEQGFSAFTKILIGVFLLFLLLGILAMVATRHR